MRIWLFEGTELGLNLSPTQFEGGVNFEGDVWCNEDGDVFFKGRFWDIDEDGGVIPLPNFQPDGDELAYALGIDVGAEVLNHLHDMASYKHDIEY